jgi:hypothetical protein
MIIFYKVNFWDFIIKMIQQLYIQLIHLGLQQMLGISLYSYPISNNKNALSFLLLFILSFQQN